MCQRLLGPSRREVPHPVRLAYLTEAVSWTRLMNDCHRPDAVVAGMRRGVKDRTERSTALLKEPSSAAGLSDLPEQNRLT